MFYKFLLRVIPFTILKELPLAIGLLQFRESLLFSTSPHTHHLSWLYPGYTHDIPMTFLRRSYDVPTTFLRRSYDVPTTFGQFLAKLSITNPKLST